MGPEGNQRCPREAHTVLQAKGANLRQACKSCFYKENLAEFRGTRSSASLGPQLHKDLSFS